MALGFMGTRGGMYARNPEDCDCKTRAAFGFERQSITDDLEKDIDRVVASRKPNPEPTRFQAHVPAGVALQS